MSDQFLRREFMRDFRSLDRHSRAVSVAIVASYLLQTFAAVLGGTWLLGQGLTPLTVAGAAALALFIGTRLRGFNNIVHECSHATFTRNRPDNRLLGSICASMTLGCFSDYRDDHMTHHAHLGDMEHDQDLRAIQRLHLEDPLTPATILRHILTPVAGIHLPYYLKVNLSARDGRAFLALKLAILAAAGLFLLLDPVPAILLVWLPLFWVFPSINYWTDCVDHGGLIENGNELESSRNMILPRAIRAILFPRNDCFHLVHHLFPQVPSQHLESCHGRLLNNESYRIAATEPMRPPEPARGLHHSEA